MADLLCKPAPQFTAEALINGELSKLSLSDYAGKYVVLFFYPLDFTFVCPTEIIAFSDAASKFTELDTVLLGCSTDSVFCHSAFARTSRKEGGLGGCSFPLIADTDHKISKGYNVHNDAGISFRGLFIIDPKQNVRIVQVNDLPVGRSVDETLRLLEALQFTDVHGEVCPANWRKGDPTIKANPQDSKEYFSQVN
ncbi:Peroxiredoxin 1 [Entomophthora muscae]|uniref:Peroxiredoxin 1 n=2 Tax=Entomophthora muscae TaxID=34485 RepID=A0ACC2UT16_9FUNG|nr:Peroxiredoxin 1 [Entomophthora muscae]KAJ9089820.1 Peroxiredoxin 1 [Entomophthora muscae]